MANVLIIGSEHQCAGWAEVLEGARHKVERHDGSLAFQERFQGAAPDVLVVEIENADGGEAMLMVQARTVWPDCRVIAVPHDRSYRSSMIFSMGLWQPDRLLVQPVPDQDLVTSVQQLWIQSMAERRINAVRNAAPPPPLALGDVVLRCGGKTRPRWSLH